MKLRLPQLLKAALLACFISASTATTIASAASLADTQGSNLGNVMYVGDSITHGYQEASYRWALFKTLTDNGIGQTEKGVMKGNSGAGSIIAPNSGYGGRIFENIHSAESGARAYEVAGTQSKGKFKNSNITNWLAQSNQNTNGDKYTQKPYPQHNPNRNGTIGATFTGDNAPNTYFIMLGTNDLLSDAGTNWETKQASLIGTQNSNETWSGDGNMDAIIRSMRLAPDSKTAVNPFITILSIPCWGQRNGIDTEAFHAAVASYNTNLELWSKANNVTYIDINKGIIDVAAAMSFYGLKSMFNDTQIPNDGLHPNAQGNLIIAGNIAKASGYAGRSAGQLRKAGTAFAQRASTGGNITLQTLTLGTKNTKNVSENIAWTAGADLSKGYTLDFQVKVGDGGTALTPSTWNTKDSFAVTLGNGTSSGTLNINEAYIQWGSTTLYSMDMSTNAESLRISYIMGDPINGLAAGFYVWLGDMLIGEALSSTANGTTTNGVTLSYGGAEGITLGSLNMTTGSWAPNTSLYVNPNSSTHFIAGSKATTPSTGMIEWKTRGFTADNNNLVATDVYNARSAIDPSTSGPGTVLGGTITSGVAEYIYANSGDYTGDIWLTIAGGRSTKWAAAHSGVNAATHEGKGTLTGNAYLRFTEGASWEILTAFGAVNATKVGGNIYLELSSQGMTYETFTLNEGMHASVVGTYNTNVTGKITIVINAGTFNHAIVGGSHGRGAVTTVGDGTEIHINGGIFKGIIIAGDMGEDKKKPDFGGGGTVNNGASITVSGGVLQDALYGTSDGVVNGGTKILIQGGSLEGNIYGGGATGDITGGTSITLDGKNAANLSFNGDIYGGSDETKDSQSFTAGEVKGGSSITLRNFALGTLANISSADAIISGGCAGDGKVEDGKSLTLNNVQGDLLSTIKEFDVLTVDNQSDVNLNYTFDAAGIAITNNGSLGLMNTADTITIGTMGQIKSLDGTGTLRLTNAQTLEILSTTTIGNSLELGGNTTINTNTFDLSFNGALTGTDDVTLTKTGTGKLTLNAVSNIKIALQEGALNLAGQASTIDLTVSGQGTSLSGANALAEGSSININGSLTSDGDIAADLNLNAGGSLNIASGSLKGNLNVAGTTTLNKAADASWTSMALAANAVLDYQVAGTTENLVLGTGQSLTANAGATLQGGLTLNGGTFILGMDNLANNGTVMSLTTGSLNVLSATSIDISSISLNQSGDYTFTLVSGVNPVTKNIVNIDLLHLAGLDDLNLLGTPVLRMDNGSLMLDLKAAASLVWNGTTTGNIWSNSDSDKNWLYDGQTSAFKEQVFVIFNDMAADRDVSLAKDITIGNLRPTSMTVDSTLGYTFAGKGNITATGKLIQKGSGSLTFTNDGVNSFLAGIELRLNAGKTEVSGKASLVGALQINADLEISSTATSSLSNVKGTGNILINGTGGASLSGTASDYTGKVTVNQGILNNQNVIGNNKLAVSASGNVTLSGISNAHLSSLTTTKAGATISGLSGSITTLDNSFVLSVATSDQEVIHFGSTGGSLDMGTLNLVLRDLALLDPTGQHTFKITDGVFGKELNTHDDFGKYLNFKVTGARGDRDHYYVLGIQGGSVTIGGLVAYENFVLDVNNKWTPHITQKQAAEFNADEFKASADEFFKSVTIDGVLTLIGTEAFTLNSLSGASTGWIGMHDGAAVTINGAEKGSVYHGTLAAGKSDVSFSGDQSMMGRTDTKTLTLSEDAHLTIGALTSVAEDLTLGKKAQLTINAKAEVQVGGNITLGTDSVLEGSGTLTITQGASWTIKGDVQIDNHLVINLLATGGVGKTAFLAIGAHTISIGGLTGTGQLDSDTAGVINLNVGEGSSLKFQGSLAGTGGTIKKLGEGTQILAASTDKNALYSLNVTAGTLIVDEAKGANSAEYKDITVGNETVAPILTAEAAAPSSPSKPTFVVNTDLTASNLTVKHDGLLVIGSNSTSASLTLTDDLDFQAGSSLEMYIGNNGDKAMIKSAGGIVGLDGIESLTLHAGISWQAYVKTILFASDNVITGDLSSDKVIMDGFGNQSITKTEDDKSIIFEASRSMENNPFRDQVTGQNPLAGLDLIWAANVEAGSKKTNIEASSELGKVFNSITAAGATSPEAHRLLAAVAGATVTALAGSQRDDFRQQQTWIRNRTVGMGDRTNFVQEDRPYVNAWIQANTGTKRIDSSGDEAGYNLNTFGGTVGFDVDVNAKITWGFAFTANYNKLTASGAESAKGRNDAYYANLFLRTQSKRWGHTLILTGGWNDAKLDRTVSGVGVNYTANGTTKGSTIGGMYEATYDYALNENKTSILQPLFNISFANASMDAYKEKGAGNASLDVGSTDASYGTASLGARLMGTVGKSLFGRSAMGELRLQLAQDFGDETNLARVGLGGIQRDVIGSKVGKTAVQVGAGITVPITEAGALYMDVNTDFRSKATDVNGSIGYRVNF